MDRILERDVAYAPIEDADSEADDDLGADISADGAFNPDPEGAAGQDTLVPIDAAMAPDPLDDEDEASIAEAGIAPSPQHGD
ncbi:hypothetical protein SNE35_24000 [Paucibacter sp. R3-3]|uniref:Uncharacterized protein n=1 Tax=Roseateles agri TaxID=3098619 RepID=A0ABU5DMS0_9BURK|nr:hypothetical protein [Paucibacter sp. R3-3]MDY0747587.1 hypothetical protein [Paucibacter sp. R3-3]